MFVDCVARKRALRKTHYGDMNPDPGLKWDDDPDHHNLLSDGDLYHRLSPLPSDRSKNSDAAAVADTPINVPEPPAYRDPPYFTDEDHHPDVSAVDAGASEYYSKTAPVHSRPLGRDLYTHSATGSGEYDSSYYGGGSDYDSSCGSNMYSGYERPYGGRYGARYGYGEYEHYEDYDYGRRGGYARRSPENARLYPYTGEYD